MRGHGPRLARVPRTTGSKITTGMAVTALLWVIVLSLGGHVGFWGFWILIGLGFLVDHALHWRPVRVEKIKEETRYYQPEDEDD